MCRLFNYASPISAVLAGCTLCLLTCASSLAAEINTLQTSTNSLGSKLARMTDRNVDHIDVMYFPEEVETIVTLTPEKLEERYWTKITIRRFSESNFRSALVQVLGQKKPTLRKGGSADLRWACIFYDRNGERMVSIYC